MFTCRLPKKYILCEVIADHESAVFLFQGIYQNFVVPFCGPVYQKIIRN